MLRISTTFFTLLVGILINNVTLIKAQIPRACVANATKPNAICCPTPAGSVDVCGGMGRGQCRPIFISSSKRSDVGQIPLNLQFDDRINWPIRFFSSACKCFGNYRGHSCHRCQTGYTGPSCSIKVEIIRRNALSLNTSEQIFVRDVLNASKYIDSDWSVMKVDGADNADPATVEKLSFHNASIYNYLVYSHLYASRSTLLDNVMSKCDPSVHILDFAHKGPAFLPWHRQFLLEAEAEFSAIAERLYNRSDFALPYWDWTNRSLCDVCTNSLCGGFSYNDPNVTDSAGSDEYYDNILSSGDQQVIDNEMQNANGIHQSSPFSAWSPICEQRDATDACHVCDPEKQARNNADPDSGDTVADSDISGYYGQPNLMRRYANLSDFQSLPTQEEVDFSLNQTEYDTAPYNSEAGNSSFRNCIEGFAKVGSKTRPLYMHNLVHSFINGTWFDTATSPNDPLFFFHHALVDKLFELWLRQQTGPFFFMFRKYPNVPGIPYGHASNDYMVPFFPPVQVNDVFIKSSLLGYSYDDGKAGSKMVVIMNPGSIFASNSALVQSLGGKTVAPIIIAAIIASIITVFALLGFMVIRQRRQVQSYRYGPISEFDDDNKVHFDSKRGEKTPLLS